MTKHVGKGDYNCGENRWNFTGLYDKLGTKQFLTRLDWNMSAKHDI